MTTIISGVIGLLMMPWKQQGGDFLVVIQSNFSTLLGPIIGIMLADYFLVRKCTLNAVSYTHLWTRIRGVTQKY